MFGDWWQIGNRFWVGWVGGRLRLNNTHQSLFGKREKEEVRERNNTHGSGNQGILVSFEDDIKISIQYPNGDFTAGVNCYTTINLRGAL